MKRIIVIGYSVFLCLFSMLSACTRNASTAETARIDSLNHLSYTCRYKNLDRSMQAAQAAYEKSNRYKQGRAEALNNLGFCAFMQMNFKQAEQYYRQVYDLTQNELELLIADIGLMKICQRTAQNKEFYDYRNSARKRMKRISEEQHLFTERHEQMRLNYAQTEFCIVSAIYYYYLQQQPEAIASINQIDENIVEADTNQLLYYHYIKGSAELCGGEDVSTRRQREFDQLYLTWLLSSRNGYAYFEGNALQGLANLMITTEDFDYFRNRRSYALSQFWEAVDSLLPKRLGEKALQKFRRYNDYYQMAGSYVTISKFLNMHGHYQQALDSLQQALGCVDLQPELQSVPECLSPIHEQLSVAYAGLGMKAESDINRNIYLDILENTRQDKELESRFQQLENENHQLNLLFSLVVAGCLLLLLFFIIFNRRIKKRNRQHVKRLQQLLEICRKITASIPADVRSREEIETAIRQSVTDDLKELFGRAGIQISSGRLSFPYRPGKEEEAMARVINPYIQWALDNGTALIGFGDEQRRLEKEHYIYRQHIANNKRQNLIKKACIAIVNGMQPYIDRIINEVQKLKQKDYYAGNAEIKREKYVYIDELVTTINEYNDILALWIKMKAGELSLNIENFSLEELFSLIRKGSKAFEMKQQTLVVEPTDFYVKADKALTLFMINTLAENARKYSFKGSKLWIYCRQTDERTIEISVQDNGPGLSAEDVARIMDEKVYNSQTIGQDTASDREELLRKKGSGFGLMNCRGIIEKYKKSSPLFSNCRFGVESELGKGSRFYFRLPLGVKKTLMVLAVMLFSTMLPLCAAEGEASLEERLEYEELLDQASDYANEAYFCNVDGAYEQAMQYIDSAMTCLNAHYEKYAQPAERLMKLQDEEEPAELVWWNSMFDSDFHVILDIRNEAAVASLALKQWQTYTYNNRAYTILYKLLGEDQSLEAYCLELQRSSGNKQVAILLAVLLLLSLPLSYYVFYYRRCLSHRWELEQVLEITRTITQAAGLPEQEESDSLPLTEETLQALPMQVVHSARQAIGELQSIRHLSIAIYNEAMHRLEYAGTHTDEDDSPSAASSSRRELMERSFTEQRCLSDASLQTFPLMVDVGSESRCIGVLCLENEEETEREQGHLLLELLARNVAIVVYNAVVKLTSKYHDLELAQDEVRRAAREDSMLHVQNQVLDNCLSTIKHETVYYPNRIKQLITKLHSEADLPPVEEQKTLQAIVELIEYYKGIFTLLSRCAERQLDEVVFRRARISVPCLLETATQYLKKRTKSKQLAPTLHIGSVEADIMGDVVLMNFLLECLIDEALTVEQAGELCLTATVEGDFVRFLFVDRRREQSDEELHSLFYPNLTRMTGGPMGNTLQGTQYLLCKQIIRDHDEWGGRRGCRINARKEEGGGFAVYFTLPLAREHRSGDN